MMSMNRETLQREQNILQTSISQSLAGLIALHMENVQRQLEDVYDDIAPLAAQVPQDQYSGSTLLTERLKELATDNPDFLYLTLVNTQARGIQAGGYNAGQDPFLRKDLERAFVAARQGEEFFGSPQTISRDNMTEPGMVMGKPIWVGERFVGMVGVVVSLAPIQKRLQNAQNQARLDAYVVNNSGRLVAHSDTSELSGRDMSEVIIVQRFLTSPALASVTSTFTMGPADQREAMLGTHSPIPQLGWGVIVQKKLSEAYYTVEQMRKASLQLGILVVALSLVVGLFSAKAITRPIVDLTGVAHSLAQRDFSRRADVRSRTEIGELAQTFNQMAGDIQKYIHDIESAVEQNRLLFMDSLSMIAAAVDAKDPYTKGHSARVSEYSVIIALEMELEEEEVNKIRISAVLHDVGKIGVEDRVLNKPGKLTEEEFDLMKRHPVMGYDIVHPVKQLSEMLPGIRWHHEALNGSGYPDGIQGDQIPLMPRIIAVADTFDAITSDRPYQAAREFPKALEILRSLVIKKYDTRPVEALCQAYEDGKLSKWEVRRKAVIEVP